MCLLHGCFVFLLETPCTGKWLNSKCHEVPWDLLFLLDCSSYWAKWIMPHALHVALPCEVLWKSHLVHLGCSPGAFIWNMSVCKYSQLGVGGTKNFHCGVKKLTQHNVRILTHLNWEKQKRMKLARLNFHSRDSDTWLDVSTHTSIPTVG